MVAWRTLMVVGPDTAAASWSLRRVLGLLRLVLHLLQGVGEHRRAR